jgi:hypothetical protein
MPIQDPVIVANTSITTPTISSPTISGTPVMSASVITSGTANTSLSGTAIDFTGIPSWVKRVTVMLNGVSTSGSNILLCQLGTSSGVVISGYVGSGGVTGISNTAGTRTDGIPLEGTGSASFAISGSLILTLLSSNTWVGSGTYGTSGSNYCFFGGGSIALGGTLDRVRITSGGSTDTFDAGSINILYE